LPAAAQAYQEGLSMAKTAQSRSPRQTLPVLAGLLAWLAPGAGHWYLGRPVRAVVLFVTLQAMFWSGIAIGGVFTVNPREEVWWCRAQLCTGVSGLVGFYRQQSKYSQLLNDARTDLGPAAESPQLLADAMIGLQAKEHLSLVPPASGLAYVLSGVAGMLNLMCIFDAVMLSLMGRYGEPSGLAQGTKEAAR
jgi:hypothetical protein